MAAVDRPPTSHDVARRAGVHPATVSRALNRPDMVSADTRSLVLEAVAEIGFVPNRSARQLVTGRTDAIGVIVPDITNPYFAAIVQAIQVEARSDDLAVLIADTGADPGEEQRALATLSQQVDGIVAITPITDLTAATRPVVQVNRQRRKVASVVVDQQAIVATAVEHLVALGHTTIAVVRGPAAYWSSTRRDRAVDRLTMSATHASGSASASRSASGSRSPSGSASEPGSRSGTDSVSVSGSRSPSGSASERASGSGSRSGMEAASASRSASGSRSPSGSGSRSGTDSVSVSGSGSRSGMDSVSVSVPDGSVHIDLLSPAAATFGGGRAAFGEVVRSGATAVVAFNDVQAAGLLAAAHDADRSVPGSLSIVGSDGLALAAMTSPPLTTVAAPLDELGRTARQRLADVLANRACPAVTTLQPRLIVRSTTAAPPGAVRNHRPSEASST